MRFIVLLFLAIAVGLAASETVAAAPKPESTPVKAAAQKAPVAPTRKVAPAAP